MIIPPNWDVLKGLTRGFNINDPIKRQKALDGVIQTISTNLPDKQKIRLYRIQDHTAIVESATDQPTKTAIPVAAMPIVADCLHTGQSIWNPDSQQWASPLSAGHETIGALHVFVERLDHDWQIWLDIIAEQLSHVLANENTSVAVSQTGRENDLANRLVTACEMLIVANDYHDVAIATSQMADDPIVALMISLLKEPIPTTEATPENLTDNQRYVVAASDKKNAQLIDEGDSLTSLPEQSFVSDLRQEFPVVITNISTDAGYLSGWQREYITRFNGKQLVSFPMISNKQLVGTIDLVFVETYPLTQTETDVFTALARQTAAIILTRRLLQRSQEAQQFASQLVKTNKAIAQAKTYQEIAQAVLNDSPESVFAVAIALFNRPFTLMGTPINLRTLTIVTRNHSYDVDYIDFFTPQEDARITYFLHEFLEGRMMLMWNFQRPRHPVMAQQLVDHLSKEDIDVVTALGLNTGNSLRGLLFLAGKEEIRDSGPQYDGLRAIADQLAAVIENRILLQQKTETLDLNQSLYDTTNRIFRTSQVDVLLKAVFDFAGADFEYGQLVSVEGDGVARVLAETTREEQRLAYQEVDLEDYPASKALIALEALEIRNTADDPFINDQERSRLLSDNIHSLITLPITNNLELTGLIMLTSSIQTHMTPERVRAMRSLADQAGVVLENRKLLKTMEANLQEIQMLYEANRAMLRTQDGLDVLRALGSTLAPDASAIIQINFHYDDAHRNEVQGLTLDYEITREEERVLNELILGNKSDLLKDISSFAKQVQDGVHFSPDGVMLPDSPLKLIASRYKIASYASLPIRERGQITGLIFLLFEQPKPFVESTRRLYDAIADQVAIAIENQKLLQESQLSTNRLANQVSILQIINDFSVRINRIKDEQALLDIFTQTIVEAVQVNHSGIVIFNEDLQTGVVVSEYPVTTYLGSTINVEDSPVLTAGYQLGDTAAISDILQSDQISQNMRDILSVNHIRAILIVPLIGQRGELIGTVGLDVYDQPREFNPTEIQTAQTLAAQVGVALQNIRLLNEARQRANQLQHISDFSQTAQSTLNLEEMIESALANVPRMLNVSHMTLALQDEYFRELILVGGWEEKGGFRSKLPTGEAIPLQGTTTGYVYDTGEYLYMPNIRFNAPLKYPHSETIQSILAMPLSNRDITLGIITIGSHTPNAYTDTDIAIFQQMVNQISVAIDNARTYTQSQRVARNKTLANDIAIQLQQQNNITNMVDLTMKEVGRAIGAKRGRIRLTKNVNNDD